MLPRRRSKLIARRIETSRLAPTQSELGALFFAFNRNPRCAVGSTGLAVSPFSTEIPARESASRHYWPHSPAFTHFEPADKLGMRSSCRMPRCICWANERRIYCPKLACKTGKFVYSFPTRERIDSGRNCWSSTSRCWFVPGPLRYGMTPISRQGQSGIPQSDKTSKTLISFCFSSVQNSSRRSIHGA